MSRTTRALASTLLLLISPHSSAGGDVRGHVEALGAFYPAPGQSEARIRLFARYETGIDERWFVVASACADAVTGSGRRGTPRPGSGRAAGIVRPLETYLERRSERVEFRVGMSNIAWGVLDELSPQDVVNPIDVSRFVLQGRSEARLPVPLARVRVFLPAELTVEGILVPFARRGVFDQLDETGSPFTPEGFERLPRSDLPLSAASMEGGVRLRGTGSGVDWGLSMYRDTVDFDRYELSSAGLTARRPSRWMTGGDIETARGDWVFRGDGAFFFDDPLQAERVPAIVPRTSFQGGVGADRRVGESTLFLNALYSYLPDDSRIDSDDEISLVGGLTRDFSSGTRTLRLFGLWNASSASGFGRVIWDAELVENLRLELGGGVFLGQGGQMIGLLDDADFVAARIRLFF